VKVPQNHHLVNMASVIVTGVGETGALDTLGLEVRASQDGPFWTSSLQDLMARRLKRVELAVSDAHLGFQEAISTVLQGVSWQRCRVHLTRNALAPIPRAVQAMVPAGPRALFAQPNQKAVREHLAEVVRALEQRWPKAAAELVGGETYVLTYIPWAVAPPLWMVV